MSDYLSLQNMVFDPLLNTSLPHPAKKNEAQVKKAAAEMESLFIYNLLKAMRATIPKSELLPGGNAEEIYTSMLDQHMAQKIASGGGIGLSDVLQQHLEKNNDDRDK